jgi:hypothetical protein
MRLLHSSIIDAKREIPRFDENLAEDAINCINRIGASTVEIYMISHRWLRSSLSHDDSHPDTIEHIKAAALCEFTNWRRSWVKHRHGFDPSILYWIDYSCFDRGDLSNNLAMLPLWVACCERFVRYETKDYSERAWCRLEILLSKVFGFADHHLVIGEGFHNATGHWGVEDERPLDNPLEGICTDPLDRAHITVLSEFARNFGPEKERKANSQIEFGTALTKCFIL